MNRNKQIRAKKSAQEIEIKHKLDEFVTVGGRRLRKGYTTGTCAAAASKAATTMLVLGKIIQEIDIDTPAGISLKLPVSDISLNSRFVECSIVKDGGDDPDITSGLKIYSRVELTEDGQISVNAGEGIGRVTLPGLKVEVGKPAINPVPMQMIHDAVRTVLPHGKGAVVTLWVPGGQEVAKKTYNPKLGIEGGISIIGTKGIVEPMSEDAWKEALALELNVLRSKGYRTCVFVFGNYGEEFAVNSLGIERERIIKISNFVGCMLDRAVECGIENILLVGHMGKLIKVAAGIFHTHSRVADARMEILTAYSALEGASVEVIRKIYACRTTGEAALIIDFYGLDGIYERISCNASKKCMEYTYEKVSVGTVLFNEDNRLLFVDRVGNEIISKLSKMLREH
jgi:cobalt-precorrin-5B (C1)-methyltransferase